MIPEAQHFGNRLRAERERLGISLETIAKQTKIKKTYFVGLENGDFSTWPAGLVFRRSYVRDYASALGIPAAPVVADFIRMFPDAEGPARLASPDATALLEALDAAPLAITFARDLNWYTRFATKRALAAAIDVVVLIAIGALFAFATGRSFWTAAGVLALVYFPATTAWFGRSLTCWYLETRSSRRQNVGFRVMSAARPEPQPPTEQVSAQTPIHVVAPTVESDTLLDSVLLLPGGSQASHATQEAPIH